MSQYTWSWVGGTFARSCLWMARGGAMCAWTVRVVPASDAWRARVIVFNLPEEQTMGWHGLARV